MFKHRSMKTKEVLDEVAHFLHASSLIDKQNPFESLRRALSLLRQVPSCRDAILEYIGVVIMCIVENYVQRLEADKSSPEPDFEETAIAELHVVATELFVICAEGWTPVFSSWCLKLLGDISTKYYHRPTRFKNLNDCMQRWMNCRATRTLMEITTQALSSTNSESCIHTLLDTSVKHSPHFDWVVAYVGSCFPNLVITRVLSIGLQDFSSTQTYEQGSNSPKLLSVVGILGHLADKHCDDIHNALTELFKWSLDYEQGVESTKVQKQAAVPYLILLAMKSATILKALCTNIRKSVPIPIILKLYPLSTKWCNYFESSIALMDIIAKLILSNEVDGDGILRILIDCSFLENKNVEAETQASIRKNGRSILEMLLQEFDTSVRVIPPVKNAFLQSISEKTPEMYDLLLSTNSVIAQLAARIIVCLGALNQTFLIDAAKFLFKKSTSTAHLALLVRILTDELVDKISLHTCKDGHFAVALAQCLSDIEVTAGNADDQHVFWKNLITIQKWELNAKASNPESKLQSRIALRAITRNFPTIATQFNKPKLSVELRHTISEIIEIYVADGANLSKIPIQSLMHLINGFQKYFFQACRDTETFAQNKAITRTCTVLQNLSIETKLARNMSIRNILEAALFSQECELFGARLDERDLNGKPDSMIRQNHKFSKTIQLTKHSSVYNGGIIGAGRRKSIAALNVQPSWQATVARNTNHLIRVVRACCAPMSAEEARVANSDQGDAPVLTQAQVMQQNDGMTWTSLLLVQFVSPDVMYNGLPWPEEEFTKVTIERDLYIRRLFDRIPLLWDLLSLVAVHRPCLCYCSVLLRAVTASLIHQWCSVGDRERAAYAVENYKGLVSTTIKVVDVMALGQLLPPPLCSIRDILPSLNSYEIVAILRDCVWSYMRDFIPAPALFGQDSNHRVWRDPTTSRPPEDYTNTLRVIMQRNIRTVGHFYKHMFISLPQND